MESSRSCKKCRSKSFTHDDTSGSLICSNCGIVQELGSLEHVIGGFNTAPIGTFIHVGSCGSGNGFSYREKKIRNAQDSIDNIMLRLGFSIGKAQDVKLMVEKVTEGEYGDGVWFPVLVGACGYVVMRRDGAAMSMTAVSSVVGCDLYELGRMVARVVEFLGVKLPEFDVVGALERGAKGSGWFDRLSGDLKRRVIEQGVFLMQCAVKWFLTTGRRPLPMVAAVLVLVAELNNVGVGIELVAREVDAPVATSKLRYKELLEALVGVGRGLPWGKNITKKNIVKNAPFVIRYMELKSRLKPREEENGGNSENVGFDLEEVIGECLGKEVEYGARSCENEFDSCYFDVDKRGFSHLEDCASEKFNVSHECLAMMYSKFLDEVASVKSTGERERGGKRKRREGYEVDDCNEWWSGKSELSKKVFLKKILEKDVGFDPMPPSFVNGNLVYKMRREKIKAAKLRIDKIMHPSKEDTVENDAFCSSESVNAKKRKKGTQVGDIDWEDLVIETLLLHKVKEEEIEKGYYNTLLDLHVFNSGSI